MTAKNRTNTQIAAGSAAALCGLLASAGVAAAAGRLLATPENAKLAPPKKTGASPTDNRPLTEDEKIVHVLNRLGFGARPDDVARVKAMGLDRYIDRQLHPEQIDDTAVDKKIAAFPMLALGGDQLMDMYRGQVTAFLDAQKLRKTVTREEAQNKPASADAAANDATMKPEDPNAAAKKRQLAMAAATPEERQEMRQAQQAVLAKAVPVRQAQVQFTEAKALRAIESERQLNEVMVDFWTNHFNIDMRKNACGVLKIADDRDVIRKYALGKFRDLLGASAKSPAMLFYLDNFQSSSAAGPNMSNIEQRLQRAKMMAARNPAAQARIAQIEKQIENQKKRPQRGGVNENYAREIMELHTLGVDGGYTQKDVQEVARCFTGWSLGTEDGGAVQPGKGKYGFLGGGFHFYPFRHDDGEKVVLGHTIPAGGGIKDGETVLDILASHPATMKHVSYQLCQRLVSDNPPATLVDRCVETWKRTDGDIREIVRTIVTSPEFFSRAAYRSKIKSPFEYAVSSVRALGGSYEDFTTAAGLGRVRGKIGGQQQGYQNVNPNSFVGQIGLMGEPLFQYQAPTGYPEDSKKWVSSGALISRLNFSLALTGGRLAEIGLPNLEQTLPRSSDPSQLVNHLAGTILHSDISPSTRATLLKQAGPGEATTASTTVAASAANDITTVSRLAALMLGAPEFQRR